MNHIAQSFIFWDRATFHAINTGLKCNLFDTAMPFITQFGLSHIQAVMVLGVAFVRGAANGEIFKATLFRDLWRSVLGRWCWVGPMMLSIIVSGLTCDVVKKFVPRERPWWFYVNEHLAGRLLNERALMVSNFYPLRVYGFPSGHTATSFALATMATILFRKKHRGLVALVWTSALLISISRIYVASHWPLDVLGGAAIGVATTLIACECIKWRSHRRAAQRELADNSTGVNTD